MQDHQLVALAARLRRAIDAVSEVSDRLIDAGRMQPASELLDALLHLENARLQLIKRACQLPSGPPRRAECSEDLTLPF